MWDKKTAAATAGTHSHSGTSAQQLDPSRILSGSIAPNNVLQSPNFSSGISGWCLFGDGTIEANEGHFRGDISAASGFFVNSVEIGTAPNWFKVDDSGNMWLGNATLAGAQANTIALLNTGVAYIRNLVLTGLQAGSDIDGQFLTADSVDYTKISVAYLSAISASLGTITAGNITLDSSGFIRSGATAYMTGIGFWLGYDTNAYKLHIGDPAGDNLRWDGTNLFINDSNLSFQSFYGDGSDGTVDINSGTFTSGAITSNALTRDAYFINLTLSGGNLNCAGYRLFVKGTLTINNGYKVHRNGNNGGNGSNGAYGGSATAVPGGTAGAQLTDAFLSGGEDGKVGGEGGRGNSSGKGENAGATVAGDAVSNALGANGKAGANGGVGGRSISYSTVTTAGTGSAGGVATASTVIPKTYTELVIMRNFYDATPTKFTLSGGTGGSGGGGAGSRDAGDYGYGYDAGGSGGGGGGGGSSAGIVVILAKKIVNNGLITANGGNGGNGGNGANGYYIATNTTLIGVGGGGGAGSGGNGGLIVCIYNSLSGAGTIVANGGSAGAIGTAGTPTAEYPTYTGVNGSAGTAGATGTIIQLQI